MSGLSDHYCRWRHTRGFGVHSPFAYRLVTEAVRPARGYVYYRELDPEMTPTRRLEYRINLFLAQELGVAPRADLDRWLANPDHPLLVMRAIEAKVEAKVEARIEAEAEARIEARLRSLGHGLLLSSRRFLLAVPRPEMVYTRYSLL